MVAKNLYDYGRKVLPHAPYCPDISSPDLDVFPKIKEPMRGRRFSSLEELSIDDIRHMNKSGVLDGIIMLPKRWDSVIEMKGDYIERF